MKIYISEEDVDFDNNYISIQYLLDENASVYSLEQHDIKIRKLFEEEIKKLKYELQHEKQLRNANNAISDCWIEGYKSDLEKFKERNKVLEEEIERLKLENYTLKETLQFAYAQLQEKLKQEIVDELLEWIKEQEMEYLYETGNKTIHYESIKQKLNEMKEV